MEEVNPRWLCDSLLANAWPQLALAACLSRRMTPDARLWLCTLSDLAGSLGANETGSRYSYRMSKAALNMAVAAAQHDYPDATLVAMSPGWVKTDMGGPGATLTTQRSVASMRAAIAALTRRLDESDGGK